MAAVVEPEDAAHVVVGRKTPCPSLPSSGAHVSSLGGQELFDSDRDIVWRAAAEEIPALLALLYPFA